MRFLAQRATSVPTSRHTWCVLEAERCRREDGRATHPHHRGGWRGGIACRNPVVKSTHEAKMRWGETAWSSVVNQRLPYGAETSEGRKKKKKHASDKLWFQRKSDWRWIPTMPRSISHGGRYLNYLRWEMGCALWGWDNRADFLHKDSRYSSVHCKMPVGGKDLFMRCNASYYGGWRCECAPTLIKQWFKWEGKPYCLIILQTAS